jgi:hypothetical protein
MDSHHESFFLNERREEECTEVGGSPTKGRDDRMKIHINTS